MLSYKIMRSDNQSSSSINSPVTIPLYAGIFFIAMSALIFQVALTRVFAILMWYHYAYLVVSLALLGFGASGSLLTVLQAAKKSENKIKRSLAVYSLSYGIAIIFAFFIVTRIEVNSFEIWKDPKAFFGLMGIFIILSVPFLLGGLTIGTCLSKFPSRVGKLYFIDLIGSSIGAIITPALLSNTGSTATIITAAALALFGSVLFSLQSNKLRRWVSISVFAGSVILVIGFNGGALFLPAMSWEIPFAPNKIASAFFKSKNNDKVLSSAVAQVNVSIPMKAPVFMGGEFGKIDQQNVILRFVTQDGTAPTGLFKNSTDLKKFPCLDDSQAASAYVALNSINKKKPEVMVIGVGGGIDVMIALFHDAAYVSAVEINSAMIRMATEEYADFIGHLFKDPRVKITNEDGRSYLHRLDRTYDIIQLSGVDTFTALSTGVYTLSESYLYTTEAVKKMYDALKKDGYINYSRFLISKKPRETIRLANTAYTALKEMEIKNPWKNIVVLQGNMWASTMIRKGPFTRKEVDALTRFAKAEDFKGMVFHPYLQLNKNYSHEKSTTSENSNSFLKTQNDFYMLLRGSEAEREDFINNYFFNLEPSTDDKPFFFNYFKFSNFLNSLELNKGIESIGEYLPVFPIGHMILLSSMFLIVLLALILIILPLKFLAKHNIKINLKLRTFIYFSSLGIGFMFIEICMMQKFILFLGHPVYSMSVVLGGILAFSGFGALFSSRITQPGRPVFLKLLAIIAILTILNSFALNYFLDLVFSLSLSFRIVLTLLLLAPISFAMGMPFPLGIRMLKEKAPELIPWAWGINGFLSVLSSIMAIVIAMITGFTWVFLIAGIIYAIGLSLAPAESV